MYKIPNILRLLKIVTLIFTMYILTISTCSLILCVIGKKIFLQPRIF